MKLFLYVTVMRYGGVGGKAAQICNLLGKAHNWSCWNSEVLSINET